MPESVLYIADLGCPVLCQPDVPGVQVPMNNAAGVSELQALTNGLADLDGAFQRQTILFGPSRPLLVLTGNAKVPRENRSKENTRQWQVLAQNS
jgi:hypothetical protein